MAAKQGGFDPSMASTQGQLGFDKTLHDLNEALDLLTDTLSGVRGCEYPRLLAREIQALIIACVAHEKVRQATADEHLAETPGQAPVETPDQAFAETPDQARVETPRPALVEPRDQGLVETPAEALEVPPRADDMIKQLAMTLEAREAEISNLRDLLHHGVDTIESHTLMDSDGTVVMHGDYQYITATAIEQWLDRAEAALNAARRPAERDR